MHRRVVRFSFPTRYRNCMDSVQCKTDFFSDETLSQLGLVCNQNL